MSDLTSKAVANGGEGLSIKKLTEAVYKEFYDPLTAIARGASSGAEKPNGEIVQVQYWGGVEEKPEAAKRFKTALARLNDGDTQTDEHVKSLRDAAAVLARTVVVEAKVDDQLKPTGEAKMKAVIGLRRDAEKIEKHVAKLALTG